MKYGIAVITIATPTHIDMIPTTLTLRAVKEVPTTF